MPGRSKFTADRRRRILELLSAGASRRTAADRFEQVVAALVVEHADHDGTALERAEAVVEAMAALRKGGLTLLLLSPGTVVELKRPRPRRWWRRRERKE